MNTLAPLLAPSLALLIAAAALPQPLAANSAPETGELDIVQGDSDRSRRMTVPVRIGEHGSFDFVIDTG